MQLRVIEDCNKGITNPNGVLREYRVQLVVRSDQGPQRCTSGVGSDYGLTHATIKMNY
jgi:hypothetical protein